MNLIIYVGLVEEGLVGHFVILPAQPWRVCFVAQDITGQKIIMERLIRIEGDYKAIVLNPNPLIPPIFGMDEFGWCSEWNLAMTKLTGWKREEVIDKMLLGEVFGSHSACCRLKNQESYVNLGVVLNNAVTACQP